MVLQRLLLTLNPQEWYNGKVPCSNSHDDISNCDEYINYDALLSTTGTSIGNPYLQCFNMLTLILSKTGHLLLKS